MIRALFSMMLVFALFANAPAAEKVSIQLRWDHQFQFAGYYAARWQGYYREAGFDVDIRPAITPDGKILRTVDEVSEGRADFGVGAADVLIACDRGMPLVMLAPVFQQSAAEFYALEETPFSAPADLLNLRVARNPNGLVDIELQAMLLSEGIYPKNVKPYPHLPGVQHLINGKVDVIPGYRISAPYQLWLQGMAFKTLRPISYGIDFYGDSLFSHQKLVEKDPDAVERFLKASLNGWRYALEHPVKISERIVREYPRTAKIVGGDFFEFNRFQAAGIKELMLYPVVEAGHTNPHRWRRMSEFMQQIGIVKNPIDLDKFVFDPGKLKIEQEHRLYRIIETALYLITGITVLIFAWTVMLRKTVARKTGELTRSERKYRELIERMEEGVWIIDRDALTTFVNPSMAKMLGYTEEEMLGRHLFSFMDNHGIEIATKKLEDRKRHIEEYHYFEFIRKDGIRIYTYIDTKPMADPTGEYAGSFAVITDITARKQAEDALRESEQRLRAIGDNLPAGQIYQLMLRPDGAMEFTHVSGAVERLHECTPEQAMADPNLLFGRVVEEDREGMRLATEKSVRDMSDFDHELRIRRKSGEIRWHRMISRPRPAKDNGIVFDGIDMDITDRKRAEEQIKAYTEQLEQMVEERTRKLREAQDELLLKERLAVLGHFAGSISHELRNPLAVIDSSAYFLTMKLGDSDELLDKHLGFIFANVKKSTAIIESLLNLSRMEKPKTNKINLVDMVSETLLGAKIPDSVNVRLDSPEREIFVDIDAEQVRMALKNIIKNAVQAMEDSGKLTISAGWPKGGMVELSIADTGPGIAPEHLEKVFEPLFSTKTHGIGFGLSIAKMIVENHGGNVRVESDIGNGSVFHVGFPVSEKRANVCKS